MECLVCKKTLKGVDVEHIALNAEGEPVVLCDECYEKVRVFFRGGEASWQEQLLKK